MASSFFSLCTKVRLPLDARDDVEEDPTGVKALWDRGVLSGASQKVCAYCVIDNLWLCAVLIRSQRSPI